MRNIKLWTRYYLTAVLHWHDRDRRRVVARAERYVVHRG